MIVGRTLHVNVNVEQDYGAYICESWLFIEGCRAALEKYLRMHGQTHTGMPSTVAEHWEAKHTTVVAKRLQRDKLPGAP